VADETKTFTQDEVDAAIAERVAAEVAGLKKNRDEALRELKALRADLGDVDPKEARDLKTRFAELEQKAKADSAGVTSEALKKLRAEARSEFEKEFGPRLEELGTLRSENRSLKLDTVVKNLMAKAGVRAERIDPLFRLSGERFDLTEDGKPMVKDASKEVDRFIIEDLSKEFPEFFNGSGSSGGGAAKSTAGSGGVIASGDQAAFLSNLQGIASGKVQVR
jgi:hypothetical protein